MTISYIVVLAAISLAILITGSIVCEKQHRLTLWWIGFLVWWNAYCFFQAGAAWQREDFKRKQQQTQKVDH